MPIYYFRVVEATSDSRTNVFLCARQPKWQGKVGPTRYKNPLSFTSLTATSFQPTTVTTLATRTPVEAPPTQSVAPSFHEMPEDIFFAFKFTFSFHFSIYYFWIFFRFGILRILVSLHSRLLCSFFPPSNLSLLTLLYYELYGHRGLLTSSAF